MSCPYLEEVVMVFCRAYPIKKLVPRNRIVMAGPCQTEHFERCPLYQEVVARAAARAPHDDDESARPVTNGEKEVSR